MDKMLFLSFLASVFALPFGPLQLEVSNGREELFQRIVELSLQLPADLFPRVWEIDKKSFREVPAQYDHKNQTLLFLLPGLTRPLTTRRFKVETSKERSSLPSDLKVEEDKDTIRITNTYYQLEFPKKGNGGFPNYILFRISGNKENFIFEDRLYEKERGYFTLRGDQDAEVKVLLKGSLKAIIEAKARYFSDHYAPGNARATYLYEFFAYSPIIKVSVSVERDDDLPWSELHFLQISRRDTKFSSWAGGMPLQEGRFTDARRGYGFSKWAVMFNSHDAIALYSEKGLSLFDGVSKYFNYIQEMPRPFNERSYASQGLLYIGPTPRDISEISRFFSPPSDLKISISSTPAPLVPKPKYIIKNEKIALGFASEEEGMGLISLSNLLTGEELIQPNGEIPPLIWKVSLSQGKKEDLIVDNLTPCERKARILRDDKGWQAILSWRNIDVGEERGVLDVEVRIELPKGSPLSFWRISVDNRSKRLGVWEVYFPTFTCVGEEGALDVAVPRSNWGMLYKSAKGDINGPYPSCGWPMQFICINKGDSGFYLAAHDPRAFPKFFSINPGKSFFFRTEVENMGVPGSDFHSFPFAVGVYKGNWLAGCKMYRQWAIKEAPWTRKGPLATRKDTPASIKNLGLWMRADGTREEVVPNMLKALDLFQVPLGVHWYNWHEIGFDTQYPNYFPYKGGFPQGVRELTNKGILVMPYINGRLWDSSLDSFKNTAIKWCTKDSHGEPYIEVYNPQVRHAVMCPFTKFWQDKVNEITARLMDECGVNAIYIDQIGAAGPALCFDRSHGHPLGGGSYWVDGYRELLQRVKQKAGGKVAITTENNTECYMDGVDAFLIWNPRNPNEIPMMTAVYSGYTIYFSSPTHGLLDDDSFAMLEGRDFLWGCQLGWMGFELLEQGYRKKAEFLRELAKYRLLALKYLLYGELLGEVEPLNSLPEVKGTWFDWYERQISVSLPAIMGTIWRGSDNTIGVLLVNASTKEQSISFQLPGSLFPPDKLILQSEISPSGRKPSALLKLPFTITETLPPRSIRIMEFKSLSLKEAEKESSRSPTLLPYLALHKAGLEWNLQPERKEIGEGEKFSLIFTAKASRPLSLSLIIDGKEYPLALEKGKSKTIAIRGNAPLGHRGNFLIEGYLKIGDNKIPLQVPMIVVDPLSLTLQIKEEPRAGETFEVSAVVTNRSERPQSIRLVLDIPSTWDCKPARSLPIDIPADSSLSIPFAISIPNDYPSQSLDIHGYIIRESSTLPIEVQPPRPSASCPFLSPQIDGDLSEWQGLAPLIPQGNSVKDWRGEGDLSGRFWVGWDEENFYFAGEVVDDVFHQPYTGKEIWQGDCIQIAFLPHALPPSEPTYEGVQEFSIALTPQGATLFQWLPQEGEVKEARVVVKRNDRRTIYEVAIPWMAMGKKKPKAGDVMGWAFTLNENDGEGFRGWLEWAGGICGTKDASLFGKIRLIRA